MSYKLSKLFESHRPQDCFAGKSESGLEVYLIMQHYVEEILQQIYPDYCIEVVRQFRHDFNVNGGDLCNDKDDSQTLLAYH